METGIGSSVVNQRVVKEDTKSFGRGKKSKED